MEGENRFIEPTIRTEEVPVKDCQAENILGQILDEKLHARVPVRVGS